MDAALTNALKRKAELERELAEVDMFIRAYHRFRSLGGGTEATPAPVDIEKNSSDESARPPGFTPPKAKNRGLPAVIADTVESVIRTRNEPMNRSELVDALEEAGIEMPAADKPRYIGTILWRHKDRFENIPGRGYWLVGLPVPDQHGGLI